MEKYRIYHPLEMMERILSNKLNLEDKVEYQVVEKDDSYVAEFLLPGYTQQDLSVEVNENFLIIEGKKNNSEWTSDFSKKFRLPDSVSTENLQAKIENGVLKLTVPKRTESISKKITIL
jgi:HSP20 family protein